MYPTKDQLKRILFAISILVISPILIFYWLLNLVFETDSLITGFSQLLSLIPGRTGSYIRVAFYRFTLTFCSRDTVISFLVVFAQQDTEIEAGVYLGPGCNIGSSRIGRNSLLGSGVHVMSGKDQHYFEDPDAYIKDQGGVLQKISIGEDCWIGNCALILANIGDKCVIGSGSVVIDDIPAYSIVAGNPARVIGSRKE